MHFSMVRLHQHLFHFVFFFSPSMPSLFIHVKAFLMANDPAWNRLGKSRYWTHEKRQINSLFALALDLLLDLPALKFWLHFRFLLLFFFLCFFLMFLFCNFCLRFWQLGHNWLIINGEQGARSRKNKNYFSFSPWIFWHQHSGWWRARKCQINEAKDKSENGKCIIMNKLLAISSREKREEKLESRVTENGSEIQCQSLWVALNLIRQWVFKMH